MIPVIKAEEENKKLRETAREVLIFTKGRYMIKKLLRLLQFLLSYVKFPEEADRYFVLEMKLSDCFIHITITETD